MQSDSQVYLRGVDLNTLIDNYLNDKYIELISPLAVDLSILDEKVQNIVSIKEKNKIYSYECDFGFGQTYAFICYKVYDKDSRYAPADPQKKYRCMYCLKKIDKNPLGLPILRQEIIVNNEVCITFHMIDIFCTINCCLAEYPARRNNQLYAHTMEYLGEICLKCTGKDIGEFKASSDKRLLKIYNGPMTWDEFHANNITYSEKPGNIFFLPVMEYLERVS